MLTGLGWGQEPGRGPRAGQPTPRNPFSKEPAPGGVKVFPSDSADLKSLTSRGQGTWVSRPTRLHPGETRSSGGMGCCGPQKEEPMPQGQNQLPPPPWVT